MYVTFTAGLNPNLYPEIHDLIYDYKSGEEAAILIKSSIVEICWTFSDSYENDSRKNYDESRTSVYVNFLSSPYQDRYRGKNSRLTCIGMSNFSFLTDFRI